MTLPPSDIERIEADANSKWPLDENVPPIKYTSSRNALMLDFRSAYVSGAQAEAVRGREMATGFADWLNVGFCNYGRGWRKKDFQGDEVGKTYPIAELLDLFLDTQKRKL